MSKATPKSTPSPSTPSSVVGFSSANQNGEAEKTPVPVHHFKFRGRKFRLGKRRSDRSAPWYLTSEINRKRFNHALGTNIASVAEKTAVERYIKPALDQRWEVVESTGIKSKSVLTLAQLFAAWRGLASERSSGHVEGCVNAVLNVLRRAGIEAPLQKRVEEVIVPGTIERWRRQVLLECEGRDQEGQARHKRSQNSVLTKARCLFSKSAVADYRAAGKVVPDVSGFLEAAEQRKFKQVAKEVAPMSRERLRGLVRLAYAREDWNEFAAVFLSLAFGLRASEVAQVRWEHFTEIDGAAWLDAAAAVKRGSGRLVVRALDPWWRLFVRRARREGLWSEGEEEVLVGSMTERSERVFRRVSDWMRLAGWKGQKAHHAFRAFAGGEVALKWGVYQAQGWLRHRSVTTTEANYTRQFLEQGGKCSARWARWV